MKNETMKNGTAIMGKDETDQFDKTKVTFFHFPKIVKNWKTDQNRIPKENSI